MDLETRKFESQLARRAATSPNEGKANQKPMPRFGPPFKPKVNGCSLHKELTETLGDFHAVSPFLSNREIQSQVVGTNLIPLTPGKAPLVQAETTLSADKIAISSEIQSIIEVRVGSVEEGNVVFRSIHWGQFQATKVGTPLSAIRTPAVSADPSVFYFPKLNKPSTDPIPSDSLEGFHRQVDNNGSGVEPRRSLQETNSVHGSANACLPPKKRHLSGSNKEEPTNNQISSSRLLPSLSPHSALCDSAEPQSFSSNNNNNCAVEESLSQNLTKSPSAHEQQLECSSRSNGKGMRETEDFFGPVSLVAEATMKAEQPFDQPSFQSTFDIFEIEQQLKQPNNPDVPSPQAAQAQSEAECSSETKKISAECRKMPPKAAKPWKTKQKPSASPCETTDKKSHRKEDKNNSHEMAIKVNSGKSSNSTIKCPMANANEEKKHSSTGGREDSAQKRVKMKSSRSDEMSSPKKETVVTTAAKEHNHKTDNPDSPDSGIERDFASPKVNNNPFSPENPSGSGDHLCSSELDESQPSTSAGGFAPPPRIGRNRRISDILAESTHLSPLLSPIPEISFPPYYEDPVGIPHLLARLNFALLSKIPPRPLSPMPRGAAPSDPSAFPFDSHNHQTTDKEEQKCAGELDRDSMSLLDRMNSTKSVTEKKQKKSSPTDSSYKLPSTKSQPRSDSVKKSKEKSSQSKPIDHHTAKKHPTISVPSAIDNHPKSKSAVPPGPHLYDNSIIDSVVESVLAAQQSSKEIVKSPNLKRCKQESPRDPGEPPLKKPALMVVADNCEGISSSTVVVSGVPAVPFALPDGNGPEDEKKFFEHAKMLKKSADVQTDKRAKLIFYLESTVYYILTAMEQEKKGQPDSSFNRPYSLITETYNLLKTVATDNVGDPNHSGKLFCLSLRLQALMSKHLYDLRQPQSLSNFKKVNEYHKERSKDKRPVTPCSNCTPTSTPSPSSSAGSCLPPGHVAIPQPMESLIKQQLTFLHNLMFADCHWKQADSALKTEDKPFFDHLDRVCGCLTFSSSPRDLCVYVLTAIRWLRDMMALPQTVSAR